VRDAGCYFECRVVCRVPAMSDDDKVVPIRPMAANDKKPDGVDPKMIEALGEFAAMLSEYKAKAFAAVAITDDGNVIDSWYTRISPAEMIGAIEMLKSDYILRHWVADDDELIH